MRGFPYLYVQSRPSGIELKTFPSTTPATVSARRSVCSLVPSLRETGALKVKSLAPGFPLPLNLGLPAWWDRLVLDLMPPSGLH